MAVLRTYVLLAAVSAAANARCWIVPDRSGYVAVPADAFTIPDLAFEGCQELSFIDLPTTVTALGARAFANTSLTRLVIPSSVIDINPGVLDNCEDMLVVSCASDACDPEWTANGTARQYNVEFDAQNSSWSLLETCCTCPASLVQMLGTDGASCSCDVTLCDSSTTAGSTTSPHSTPSTMSTPPANSSGGNQSTTTPHTTPSTTPGNSSNASTTGTAASTSSRSRSSRSSSSHQTRPSTASARPRLPTSTSTLSPDAIRTAQDHKNSGTAAVVMVIVFAILGGAGYFAYTGGCFKRGGGGGGALREDQGRAAESARKQPKRPWRSKKGNGGGGYANPFAEFNNPNDAENDDELDTFA